MRYLLSGLLGFFVTLMISLPVQHLMQIKEARASGSNSRFKSGLGAMQAKGLARSRSEIDVNIAPLAGVAVNPREPRIKFLPQYPQEAAEQHLEGFVTLSFVVAADGSVQQLKVVESVPPAIFDSAARTAVARWTFRAPANKKDDPGSPEMQEQKLRLNFSLKKNLAAEDAPNSSL
ncbi:MAG: energy transducer TonB [Proteobacteria bacterium]|nr:energy transducer TonB [Pseudomonadota bacterium]